MASTKDASDSSSLKMDSTYSDNSQMQQTATAYTISRGLLAETLKSYLQAHPKEEPFRICEYGSADGSNSMTVLKHIISTIWEVDESKKIEITCNDLPSSDLSGLSQRLNQMTQELNGSGKIFSRVCGDSFYNQIVPDGTLDLTVSFTSVHWISKAPCFLASSVYSTYGLDSLDAEMTEKWGNQCATDWNTFVQRRRKELKPTGLMYVTTIGAHSPACQQDFNMANVNIRNMSSVLKVLERYDLLDHKIEFCLPATFRQEAQFREAFGEESGMAIDHYEDFDIETPIMKTLIEKWDIDTLIKVIRGGSMAVTGPFYRAKLAKVTGEKYSEEKREEILVEIFDEMFRGFKDVYTRDIMSPQMTYNSFIATKKA